VDGLRKGGLLLYDEDLVKLDASKKNVKLYSVPAARYAEELGNRIVANIVMLGFFTAITGIVSLEAMEKAVPGSVPGRLVDLNMKAFYKGYEHGKQQLETKATASRKTKK
jgi:2-oxoglutarate ferredoxin oxidoreductase subunit gamma